MSRLQLSEGHYIIFWIVLRQMLCLRLSIASNKSNKKDTSTSLTCWLLWGNSFQFLVAPTNIMLLYEFFKHSWYLVSLTIQVRQEKLRVAAAAVGRGTLCTCTLWYSHFAEHRDVGGKLSQCRRSWSLDQSFSVFCVGHRLKCACMVHELKRE